MLHHLSSYIVGTFIALFPIANPFGAVPVFYSLTATDTPAYRLRQARKVALNVIGVLAVSLLAGRGILSFLGIASAVLPISSLNYATPEILTIEAQISKIQQNNRNFIL